MWGRDQRGNNAACLALTRFHPISPLPTSRLCPFRCWFPGVWVCVHSRTLWVSPMNFPIRLRVSSTAETHAGFYSQRFWVFSFPMLEPWVVQSVLLPSCSSWLICTRMWVCSHLVTCPCHPSFLSLPLLPVWMNFFNSLVVGLPYSSIFWQF